MIDNFMDWILGIAILGAVITIVGFVTSRDLPKNRRKIRTQKFAAVAVALMFFSFSVFRPFVSSYSNAKHLNNLKVKNINSLDDVIESHKEQAEYIEDLKEDVRDLRADLYSTNRYYGNITQLLSTALAVFALNFGFRKRKEEENDSEEIQSDQISKL